MANPILPDSSRHIDRLVWILELLRDDTLMRSNVARERREKKAFHAIAKTLHTCTTKLKDTGQ